jgi:uncharacterized phage protein gp47/JayE
MAEIENNNVADIIENWDHSIQPSEAENLKRLLEVVASENRRLDLELDELYDNRFLSTATGVELEKIGDLVGVIRKENESDAKLRKRIRGGFAAQASETTYDSFTSAALSILDAGPEAVEFITPPDTIGPKVVQVQLDGAVFDENPLTENELAVLLNGALSIDGRTDIKQTGTFAFEGDDSSLEGFDEGTWSVGVN